MVTKVYSGICALFAITAAVLFLTGNFPAITAVIFGFIAFGIVFMGMMFVLPYSITHAGPFPVKNGADPQLAPVSSLGRLGKQNRQGHAQHVLVR